MVTTPNMFGTGFDLAELTSAINVIPNLYGRLNELNLFPTEGITTPTVIMDQVNGVLSILPESDVVGKSPGAPATVGKDEERKALTFKVPHIPHEDAIFPSDVQGRRAPGSTGPDTMELAYLRKLEAGRRKFALTLEYLRMGALKGTIVGGSGRTLYNLYNEFGITAKSVDFALGTAGTDVMEKCYEVVGHIEDNLKGEIMTSVHALVSPEFFTKLIKHASVKEAYKYFAATDGQVNPNRQDVRRRFPFGPVVFEEYRASGTLADGTSQRFIAANEGHAFPLGTLDTFKTFLAPANHQDFVGTIGMEAYAWPMPTTDGRGIKLFMESNPLPLCRRPALLVKVHSSN